MSDTATIIKTKTGKIVVYRMSKAKFALFITLAFLTAVTILGFIMIDTNEIDLGQESINTAVNIFQMFSKPIPDNFTIGDALLDLLATLCIAFLTTLIGAVLALGIGLLAARNITNEKISNAIKTVISFIRAVDTVLWVLIFAIGASLGAVAAVIGMSFHTVGYLVKAYSEAFEELDAETIDALKASGATWPQIIFQTIIPSSATYLLSWTFFRFEINFAVAVAMGAAAGAGGLGYQLFMASFRHNIHEIGFITYLLLGTALIMEVVGMRLKSKFHIHE